jgi:hypothetical protein
MGKCRHFKPTKELAEKMASRYKFHGSTQELKQGLKVEQEHCDITCCDVKLTATIALAHLREVPDYYTKLKIVEGQRNKTI